MLRHKPISWYLLQDRAQKAEFNNHNLHAYDPYHQKDGKLLIDQVWWTSLTEDIKERIKRRILEKDIEFTILEVPHEIETVSKNNLIAVYFSYIEGFDYHVWFKLTIENGPKDVTLLKLEPAVKRCFKILTRKNLGFEDTDIQDVIRDSEYIQFVKSLESTVQKYRDQGKELFVRLSVTSGKNEKGLEPLKTVEEVLQFLTNNRLFYDQEYAVDDKETYVVIMPWNNELDDRREFRIFVKDGKLAAISQQRWFQLYQYSDEELEEFEKAFKDLKFLKDLPYHTFVGDVYVKDGVCYLIECNPFGAHCGAGSALFNWLKDADQLNGRFEDIEFRYLTILL